MGRNREVIVDLSDHQEDSAVDLDAKSPQHADTKCIIMGEEMSDMEINSAQQELKNQFFNFNSLRPRLFQEKQMEEIKCKLCTLREGTTGLLS